MIAVFFALIALAWLLLTVAAIVDSRDASTRLDPPETSRSPIPLPAVDVVIPARNEEANIGACLEALLLLDHAPSKIIVVDDQSSDRTGAIVDEIAARDPRVTRVKGEGPPAGWHGKPAALVRGVSETSAPWLLFVDADVRLGPACLRAALIKVESRGWKGITLWGLWDVPALMPRLLQSCIGGLVRGINRIADINDPSKKPGFINGQFLLITRDAYDALGGWGAVKGAVLEDVALGRAAKAAKIPIGLLKAPGLMTVVPYRTLAEIWSGYAKNLVDGAGGATPALALAAAVFLGAVFPFVWAATSLLASLTDLAIARGTGDTFTGIGILFFSSPTSMAALIACSAAIIFRWSTAEIFHHPRRDAFLHPVANAMFVALLVDAARRRARGLPVLWKDRPV